MRHPVWIAAFTLALTGTGCGGPESVRYPPGAMFAVDAVTLDGASLRIAGPGPVRLIEVGATWCEGCVWSADGLRDLAARHPLAEVVVLLVDTDRAAIDRFVASHALPGALTVCARPACADQFRALSLPLFMVLDRDGRMVGAVSGYTLTTMVRLERLLHRAGLRHRGRPPSGGLSARARSDPTPGSRGSRARRASGPGSGWSGSGP